MTNILLRDLALCYCNPNLLKFKISENAIFGYIFGRKGQKLIHRAAEFGLYGSRNNHGLCITKGRTTMTDIENGSEKANHFCGHVMKIKAVIICELQTKSKNGLRVLTRVPFLPLQIQVLRALNNFALFEP